MTFVRNIQKTLVQSVYASVFMYVCFFINFTSSNRTPKITRILTLHQANAPIFSKSLMVWIAVATLGCSELFLVEPGVKVDGRYYCEVLLKQQMLPVMCHIVGDVFVFQQDSVPLRLHTGHVRLSSSCSSRHRSSSCQICDRRTVLIWTRSTI